MGKRYTKEEDSTLRKYWFTEGSVGCCVRLPQRTILSIQARAYKLGIKGDKRFGGWASSKDISGQLFGDWVEIEYDSEESKIRIGTYYRCVCKCGNIVFIRRDKLARKNPQKSCGHCNDIVIGKKYYYLEPVCRIKDYVTPNGRHHSQYMNICHYKAQGCKGFCVVRGGHLKDGGNKSCGCFRDEKARIMMLNETGPNSRGWKEEKFCITSLQKRVYNSKKYKKWRNAVFERDSYICQRCKEKDRNDLRAHHIKPFARIWKENNITIYEQAMACKELWDISNGITLSEEWHSGILIDNPLALHRIYGVHNCMPEDFYSWMEGVK